MPLAADFTVVQAYHLVINPTKDDGSDAPFEGRVQGEYVVGSGTFQETAKDGTPLPATELRILPDVGPYDVRFFIDADPGAGVVELSDNVRGNVADALATNMNATGAIEAR